MQCTYLLTLSPNNPLIFYYFNGQRKTFYKSFRGWFIIIILENKICLRTCALPHCMTRKTRNQSRKVWPEPQNVSQDYFSKTHETDSKLGLKCKCNLVTCSLSRSINIVSLIKLTNKINSSCNKWALKWVLKADFPLRQSWRSNKSFSNI